MTAWDHVSKNKRREDLLRDLYEVSFPGRYVVRGKLFLYSFLRPLRSFFIARFLESRVKEDSLHFFDRFLWGEGGFYRTYAYALSSRYRKLRGSRVLVPGAGYGGNILQLASFRPQEIVAFDPVSFPEEWALVADEAKRRFGVPVRFLAAAFDDLPRELGMFDAVFSDAVLMYVKNPDDFVKVAHAFLKPGGLFYASIGFPWFGPRGDTLPWRGSDIYNHVLLDSQTYHKRAESLVESIPPSSRDYFASLIREDSFSRFRVEDYLSSLRLAQFKKELAFVHVDPDAVSLLKSDDAVAKALDQRSVPRLDRYARGVEVWMRKRE